MFVSFVLLQASSDTQMKKLEEQLSEANRRGDDLQRTLTELSVAKNRLTGTGHQDPSHLQHIHRQFLRCLSRSFATFFMALKTLF